jgi:glycosyltransferase involved in cell wall biosynthesis
LLQELREYDVVHIHSLYLFPQLAAFLTATTRHVPYIVSPHGALVAAIRERHEGLKRITDILWLRRMLDHASALHYTTDAEADGAADLQLCAPYFVVPNGIDVADFANTGQPERFRSRFLAGFRGRVVLCLGRIARVKGLDILIRAFARANVPDSLLVIAGPDDEVLTPLLSNVATQIGIRDRVVFAGELRGADRIDAFAAASAWALPSETESFGHAIVEAMAAGVPVAVSREVALADEIKSEKAGLVVPRTPEGFAAALDCLLKDTDLQSRLSRRGQSLAKRFDWSEVTPRLLTMYETVRDGRPVLKGTAAVA